MFLGIDIHDHYAQIAVVDDDGNLQDEIRLPIDRLDDLAEEYAGGQAAIEASETIARPTRCLTSISTLP